MNRLKEGFVLIPNPYNLNRLSRVNLTPDNIDCIVFWTKNPLPMLQKFSKLDAMGYPYYVQFTLTPYDQTIEPNLPAKTELVRAFQSLSKKIGSMHLVWRYDPVIVDAGHSIEWHAAQFHNMCCSLQTYTERCVISFVDSYNSQRYTYVPPSSDAMHAIALEFSKIAKNRGITLYTCAEEIDLLQYGIQHSVCIDQGLIEKIIGQPIMAKKDKAQRAACCCIESVDIGAYNTCPHGCTYCYAVSSSSEAKYHASKHNANAPMLTGYPLGHETITDRTSPSQIIHQLRLF